MLGIVKRTEEEFAEWLAEEWGFLCGLASFDDEPLVLEPYQIAFLQNRSRFRWVTKSRQVGFSFLFALEALARCHLREKHTAVFVSYNLDDAKEKILVARQVHEELPHAYQKRLGVAGEAARARFRPILMTSFAFILGVVPLVLATGAGANARASIGITVFTGMIASTCLAVLFVPSFFVIVQRFEEWLTARKTRRHPAPAE
jgi:hypothetical protein